MSKWLFPIAAVPFLLACASIPAPEGPDDSLVIGCFTLDFPDGFFDQTKRTITSGVTLNFINETTGKKFWITTSDGFYQFLSNGTDSYLFDSYHLQSSGGSVGGEFNKNLPLKPHCVVYLGHMTVIYAKPQKTHKTSMDEKTVYWNYERSVKMLFNEGELRTYLSSKDPQSPWLDYEVVR